MRVPDTPDWVLDAAYFVTGQDLTPSKYVAYLGWVTLVVTFLAARQPLPQPGRPPLARGPRRRGRGRARRHPPRPRPGLGVRGQRRGGRRRRRRDGAVVRLAAPSGFSLTLSLTLLTAVVLGGLGSLTGALVGAALLTFLPQVVTDAGVAAGLDDIRAAELAPLVYGLVMVAVILLAPGRPRRQPAPRRRHRPRAIAPPPRRENPDEHTAQEAGRRGRRPHLAGPGRRAAAPAAAPTTTATATAAAAPPTSASPTTPSRSAAPSR